MFNELKRFGPKEFTLYIIIIGNEYLNSTIHLFNYLHFMSCVIYELFTDYNNINVRVTKVREGVKKGITVILKFFLREVK